MRRHELIRESLQLADQVAMAYLKDLNDEQLAMQPHSLCHSIYWQIGHLVLSEHDHMRRINAAAMPDLPLGFDESFKKDSKTTPSSSIHFTKRELMAAFRTQRAGTLALLALQSDSDLDEPTGVPYAPTRAALFQMQGAHWLMHCGQWVIVRRQLGLPIAI